MALKTGHRLPFVLRSGVDVLIVIEIVECPSALGASAAVTELTV